jgi:hypothetical protein
MMITSRLRLNLVLLTLALCSATAAQGASVSYAFSGSFDFSDPSVTESGSPLSDYLPQLAGITSFTGSFDYQYGADQVLVPNTFVPGATTLHIDSVFGGAYSIGRSAPAPSQDIVVSPQFVAFELGNFGAPGNPPVGFQPSVLIENMQILAYYDTLPTLLSDVDLTSPAVTKLDLRIRLKVFDDGLGGYVPTNANAFPIAVIAPVPEPSASVLGALALSVLAFVAVRRNS